MHKGQFLIFSLISQFEGIQQDKSQGEVLLVFGFYLRPKGKTDRVVVSVELLQRSLEVEVGDWALERVPG